MADQYLYYVGGSNSQPEDFPPYDYGAHIFSYYDYSSDWIYQSTTLGIDSGGTYDGYVPGSAIDGSHKEYSWYSEFSSRPQSPYFSIGVVQTDTLTQARMANFTTNNSAFKSTDNTLNDTTLHHGPSTGYKIIVPGSITPRGCAKDGVILTYAAPIGSLGAYANHMNLKMLNPVYNFYPVAGDTDVQAAEKILMYGYGILGANGTNYCWIF